MAVEKIRLGTNEDGSPHYLFRSTDPDAHLVVTGPNVSGEITLDNGETVDVTDLVIEVPDEATAARVSNAIGEHFAAEGHPAHTDGGEFVHEPLSVPRSSGKKGS